MEAKSTTSRPFNAILDAGRSFIGTPPVKPTLNAELQLPEYWSLDRLAISAPRIDWARTTVPLLIGLAVIGIIAIFPGRSSSGSRQSASGNAMVSEIVETPVEPPISTEDGQDRNSVVQGEESVPRLIFFYTLRVLAFLFLASNSCGLFIIVMPGYSDFYDQFVGVRPWSFRESLAAAAVGSAGFCVPFLLSAASMKVAKSPIRRLTARIWTLRFAVIWILAFILIAFNSPN